ncbi:MAG: replication-relaxation family protein [Actinomycetota bacterium]|nr:replication-relaxation family protein [Actinomycetota bacterium]
MTRSYLSLARLERLATELAERDRSILRILQTVRLASSAQLQRLHFANEEARNRRRVVASLVEKGFLERLPRSIGGVRSGSAGYLYTLGAAGLRLLEIEAGGAGVRARRPWVPGWAFIAHALQVTEIYVELVEARRTGRIELFHFQGEPGCWRTFFKAGGVRTTLKPDARVCVVRGEYEHHYFVEVDRGTEWATAIRRKLDTYRAYWASGREQSALGLFPWVLFVVPGSARAETIRDLIGRQPKESHRLFRVALVDETVETMTGGLP